MYAIRSYYDTSLKAFENQDYQFEDLVDKLDLKRDMSRNPLFDVMLVLQNMNLEGREIEGIEIVPFEYEKTVTKFDILLTGIENKGRILFELEYSTALFKKETIERMIGHFRIIINEIIKNPSIQLSKIDMLAESERHQILNDFNNTKADYPKNITIHELFEKQVDKTPDNIAAMFRDDKYTYRELNARANQLARILRNKGDVRDSIVAVP